MTKKFIDVMDTTFRDGFQSVFGGRVLMEDFLPAVDFAKKAGINHFEFGGGARFQSLYFYLNEDAFEMMDRFRAIVGDNVNLQTLSRGINTVTLETGSKELIDLHAKLFKKHGTTTVRNFDALNDVDNLIYPAKKIKSYGLKHEVVITMMDLPPGCHGTHDVAFYEQTLRDILNSGMEFDSICFKDASGTSNPNKVYETIKMARGLLPKNMHIRLHTHETAGVSVAAYLAALEAGVDGIDLAAAPVSGGTSQPDILTMMHALKGTKFNLGGLDLYKILRYEKELQHCLSDYFVPPEATKVSSMIPFSPMPGGALTANTQMMRDNGIFDKFSQVIEAMGEVVHRGGYGTSVTPVSQFYFQQALENVLQGPWKSIAPGFGKMVLGYFGKTPVKPDSEIVKLASKQLKLKPTTRKALDIADEDETKSLAFWRKRLEDEKIKLTDENLFIAAACQDKGIIFLKGEAKVNVRKLSSMPKESISQKNSGSYTVLVDGQRFSVEVVDADVEISNHKTKIEDKNRIKSLVPGNIWKIPVKVGQKIKKGDTVAVVESMKMEIDISSNISGTIESIDVKIGGKISEGDVIAHVKP